MENTINGKQFTFGDLESNRNSGWLVARNPIRALNHLQKLKHYTEIAGQLKLSFQCPERDRAVVEKNMMVLDGHHQEKISTDEAIRRISAHLETTSEKVGAGRIKKMLRSLFPVAHMEFHPTDLCNLACRGCTYEHDDPTARAKPDVFPFDALQKIKSLEPESIVVVGGGEPTLYRDRSHGFDHLMGKLRQLLPAVKFGLITNGTYFPEGCWYKEFEWARVSVDAASAATFKNFRGKDLFDKVCGNLLRMIETEIKDVGVGFLYSKENIDDYTGTIEFFYRLVKSVGRGSFLDKLNIQFRPLRRDPKDEGRPFPEALLEEDIRRVSGELCELADSTGEMRHFITYQTNAEVVEKGNAHKSLPFTRCHYSLIFNILRANGNLYPCFITVDQPEFCLGNLLTDTPETIALNKLLVAGKLKEICNPQQCRQCHVNNILERGLAGEVEPSSFTEVKKNPFF